MTPDRPDVQMLMQAEARSAERRRALWHSLGIALAVANVLGLIQDVLLNRALWLELICVAGLTASLFLVEMNRRPR